jgi:hypothetical protein
MRGRWAWPSAAAAVAGGLSLLLLRRGVVMGPDSWAYWEGSVSILERGRYAYFGDAPITAFPPLFALVLAFAQAALGISARTLALTLAGLAAGAAFSWVALYEWAKESRSRADVLAATAIPATLAVSGQTLLSESLWLVLLPVLLVALVRPSPRETASLAWIAVFLGALLLTRNATIALLPGVALLLWRRQPDASRWRRASSVLAVLAGALAPWVAVRAWLGQGAAHPLGHGSRGLLGYSREALTGLAYGLGPDRWWVGAGLLLALAALLAWELAEPPSADRSRAAALVSFALLGVAGHVLLFRLVFVAEPIRGRFVVFAVLLLTIATLALASRRRAFLALGLALTAVALYRAGTKARLAGLEQPAVALDVRISSSYPAGPPRPSPGGVLVAPPTYPWIPHR